MKKPELVSELSERLSVLITPAGVMTRRTAHIQHCGMCRGNADSLCPALQHIEATLAAAIEHARWKPPVPVPLTGMPVSYTHPDCAAESAMAHGERHDNFACEKCQLYAIQRKAELDTK